MTEQLNQEMANRFFNRFAKILIAGDSSVADMGTHELATAILLVLGNVTYLVVPAHFIDKLNALLRHESFDVQSVTIWVNVPSRRVDLGTSLTNEDCRHYFRHPHQDIGFIAISKNTLESLVDFGMRPFSQEEVSTPEETGEHILTGGLFDTTKFKSTIHCRAQLLFQNAYRNNDHRAFGEISRSGQRGTFAIFACGSTNRLKIFRRLKRRACFWREGWSILARRSTISPIAKH